VPQILITGASRGIGLALAQEYAARDWRVLAACREPSGAAALHALTETRPNVTIHAMDVSAHDSVDRLATELKGQAIDVVCNNAGIGGGKSGIGEIDFGHWRRVLEVNLFGAIKVSEAFLPNVEAGAEKKIVAISSSLGSISATRGGNYAYRTSKAALNMAVRSLAMDLKERGVIAAVLSPGIVDTDFTRGARMPKISPAESAAGLADIIANLSPEHAGQFLRYNGETVPW
jgi:NAD(P)-dependent dehydrogenase (short-subunit alcohol dehydrogenase family)